MFLKKQTNLKTYIEVYLNYSATSGSHLSSHPGLHITLGAFTISPIESLYPDTNEHPLSLRRQICTPIY